MTSIIVAIVGLYVAVVVAAYVRQRSMMYFPDPQRVAPATVEIDADEISFSSGDGVELVAWYKAAAPGEPTVLYFTGNAGSVAWRAERMRYIAAKGYGFLFLNYRGYGGSTGSPHEEGLVADGLAAYQQLTQRGVTGTNIILFGESLGAAVAVQTASQREVRALILEAPFTSAVDVAVKTYPYLPARWLMKDRFESANHIKFVGAPVLIIHGTIDQVVPFALGKKLYDDALDPKQFMAIPDMGHNELDIPAVRARVEQFIDDLTD
jgi:hypothetical protein